MTIERVSSGTEPPKTPLGQLLAETPKVDPAHFTAEFMSLTHFREKGKSMQLVRDIIGLIRRRGDGTPERYLDTYRRETAKSGKRSAAIYGDAKIGDEDVVLFAMNWGFFRGSFGEIEGEKFVDAVVNYAASRKLPVVAIVPSAGARQQESTAALMQIPRMIYALGELKRKTASKRVPYIPVHLETFGGLSVSVAYGDYTIGVRGSRSGFSGPGLIQAYQKFPPLPEDQSVEMHYLRGNLDYLVNDAKDIYSYLAKFLKAARNRKKNKVKDEASLRRMMDKVTLRRRIGGTAGFMSILHDTELTEKDADIVAPTENTNPDLSLADWMQKLSFHPGRVDMEDILRYGVEDVVPLYLRWKLPGSDMLEYPAIIGAIGRIGVQSFLYFGNQPGYYALGSTIRKRPSTPDVRDFERLQRLTKLGELFGLDCVYFTSTPGASASVESERGGISRAIYQAIEAGLRYRGRVQTIVLDLLGSGGGLATAPLGDHFSMLSKAVACVAAPQYATVILSGNASPTPEDVQLTAHTSRITAQDQLDMGIIDEIIPEPIGGDEVNPTRTIEEIVRNIFRVSVKLNQKSLKQVLEERGKRILGLHIIPLQETRV